MIGNEVSRWVLSALFAGLGAWYLAAAGRELFPLGRRRQLVPAVGAGLQAVMCAVMIGMSWSWGAGGHAVRAAGRRPRQRAHRHDPPRRPGHDPAHPDRRGAPCRPHRTATLASAQVAALRLTLRRLTADGSQWATSAAVVPLPGVWTLTLDVALGPADAYATSASYRVW